MRSRNPQIGVVPVHHVLRVSSFRGHQHRVPALRQPARDPRVPHQIRAPSAEGVAFLADGLGFVLFAGGVAPRNQSQVGTRVAGVAEALRVANHRDENGGDDASDTGNGPQAVHFFREVFGGVAVHLPLVVLDGFGQGVDGGQHRFDGELAEGRRQCRETFPEALGEGRGAPIGRQRGAHGLGDAPDVPDEVAAAPDAPVPPFGDLQEQLVFFVAQVDGRKVLLVVLDQMGDFLGVAAVGLVRVLVDGGELAGVPDDGPATAGGGQRGNPARVRSGFHADFNARKLPEKRLQFRLRVVQDAPPDHVARGVQGAVVVF